MKDRIIRAKQFVNTNKKEIAVTAAVSAGCFLVGSRYRPLILEITQDQLQRMNDDSTLKMVYDVSALRKIYIVQVP